MRIPAKGLIVPVAVLLLWQLAVTTGLYGREQLPPPSDLVEAAGELLGRGELGRHLLVSCRRVLAGFLLGTAAALLLGALVGMVRPVRELAAPGIAAIRAVPSLAWVPLLVLWMGIGEGPKITLIAVGAFFPVYTTVSAALAHADTHLLEVGRAYGLRGPTLLGRILLPSIAPAAFAGLRLGLAQAWLFLVAAELIASAAGLGFLLTDSQNTGRTDVLLLAIVLLALLGKATDAALGLLERRLPA